MKEVVKKPWVESYGNVRESLEYPHYSMFELIKNTCEKYPKKIAYNYFGSKISYKKFLNQIDIASAAFLKLGVRKGDVVCIVMPNTPEAIISFYALNKIGAISNLIHPLSAENELKYYFNLVKSKYVLCIDVAFNKINHIVDETSINKVILVEASHSMPEALKMGYEAYTMIMRKKVIIDESPLTIRWKDFYNSGKKYAEEVEIKSYANDVAAIMYSGGTSGKPKGIELTNYNINAAAISLTELCECLDVGDKVLAILPIFHGFGLGVCVHTTLYFGGTSILIPQFSSKSFHNLFKKYKPNVVIGVPTLWEALLKNKKMKKINLGFLKCVISGGDSLSLSLKNKVEEFFSEHGSDVKLREGYGLTECVCGTCLNPLSKQKELSIGVPLPDTIYKIVKPGTEHELSYGKMGEIIISGPTVMKGYYNDAKETENTLKKDFYGRIWLHTGDLGVMDKEGFVYYKQRLKRMIVSSGYNVYPQQIESVINSHPDVLLSCVIGVPHEYKKEVAKAFIVLKPGVEQTEAILNSIKKICKKNLSKFSIPTYFEFRNELPKTLVGKVAYTKLENEEKKKLNFRN